MDTNQEGLRNLTELCTSRAWKELVVPALLSKRSGALAEWLSMGDPTAPRAVAIQQEVNFIDWFLYNTQGQYDMLLRRLEEWRAQDLQRKVEEQTTIW